MSEEDEKMPDECDENDEGPSEVNDWPTVKYIEKFKEDKLDAVLLFLRKK